MNIYFVERIRLHDLGRVPSPPIHGDWIVYFREAQDFDGSAGRNFTEKGVNVCWGRDLLTCEIIRDLDRFIDNYLKNWFLDDGFDFSRVSEFSMGEYISGRLTLYQKPALILTLGEICRRALDVIENLEPGAKVWSDIRDGESYFANQINRTEITPRRRLVKYISESHGLTYSDLDVKAPLPRFHRSDQRTGSSNIYVSMLRAFLGGLRPSFLIGRIKCHLSRDRSRKVYIYLNHGIKLVAEFLALHDDIQVYGDRRDIPGVIPLRYDHLFAWPSRALRSAYHHLKRRFKGQNSHVANKEVFAFNGFNYGPFLLEGIGVFLSRQLPSELIKMAQGIKLLKKFKGGVVEINGDTPAMYTTMGFGREIGVKVIYLDHGMNIFAQGFRRSFINQKSVTYICHGYDHRHIYGSDLPNHSKPPRPVIGNPATVVMNGVRGKRVTPPRNRVLFSNYTPGYANNCGRFHYCDRYMRDLMLVAGRLIAIGKKISYRPHHAEDPEYVDFVIQESGLAGQIVIDMTQEFHESLVQHDVFVANTTTCVYQALYAGWPTIFYEPMGDHDYFVGLPNAGDIYRPIAQNPEALFDLIIDAFDGSSEIACFPEKFSTEFAPRFIGIQPENSVQLISEFMANESSRPPSVNAGSAVAE
ncbi:MAG: hypothetical protein CMM45_07405 [Rhodospirillaceae bacterium]|nr:hypothetical protein [Rhodospirillaceae bacterium]